MLASDAKVGMRVKVDPDAWLSWMLNDNEEINPKKFKTGIIKAKATNGNSAAVEFDRPIPSYTSDCHGRTKTGHGKYVLWEHLEPADKWYVGKIVTVKKNNITKIKAGDTCLIKHEGIKLNGSIKQYKLRSHNDVCEWVSVKLLDNIGYTNVIKRRRDEAMLRRAEDRRKKAIVDREGYFAEKRAYPFGKTAERLERVIEFDMETSIDPAWKSAQKLYMKTWLSEDDRGKMPIFDTSKSTIMDRISLMTQPAPRVIEGHEPITFKKIQKINESLKKGLYVGECDPYDKPEDKPSLLLAVAAKYF